MVDGILRHPAKASWIATEILGGISLIAERMDRWEVHGTLLQKPTQVRFWIHLKIPTEYDYRMPRLPENQKIKIPQVGSLTNKFQK